MAVINTNVSSLIAQRVLGKNNKQLNQSLQRLSTGLKINSGADNPAGLIASENLRAEQTGIKSALSNAERAGNVVATAEGGLSEVSSLLNEVQGLVTETANSGGLSKEEIDANQSQVDAILNTINRLSGSVNFQGKKLLNGELDYQKSGADLADLNNVQVNSAKLVGTDAKTVDIAVASAAETAVATFAGPSGTATGNYVLEIAGNNGTEQLSFLSAATSAQIVDAINAVSDQTGVSAVASGGINLFSTDYGSSQFASVKTVSGDAGVEVRDEGKNAVVTVNGASAEVDGRTVSYRSSNLDVSFDLNDTSNAAGALTFDIDGGGATFSLGAKVTEADKASLGIQSVSTGTLGLTGDSLKTLASGGTNSLSSGDLTTAQKVVSAAIKQVAETRGRLGAFQKFVINSTVNQLGVAQENAAAAESAIRDTDFAAETAALTRAQILSQASTNILSQANSQPQLALQLLQ